MFAYSSRRKQRKPVSVRKVVMESEQETYEEKLETDKQTLDSKPPETADGNDEPDPLFGKLLAKMCILVNNGINLREVGVFFMWKVWEDVTVSAVGMVKQEY